jgi:hypothetical protein
MYCGSLTQRRWPSGKPRLRAFAAECSLSEPSRFQDSSFTLYVGADGKEKESRWA